MVQNAGNGLKFGVKIKGVRMKIVAICMVCVLYFR